MWEERKTIKIKKLIIFEQTSKSMYTHSKFRDLNKREEKKTSFSVMSYPMP